MYTYTCFKHCAAWNLSTDRVAVVLLHVWLMLISCLLVQVVALITIEVHARDVIEKLGKVGCTNANDFEWVSQLRFYWDKDQNDCIVKQASPQPLPNLHMLVLPVLTPACNSDPGHASCISSAFQPRKVHPKHGPAAWNM